MMTIDDAKKLSDPERELKALWIAQGISPERQDQLIAQIAAKAVPGAQIGPFTAVED